MTYVIAEPCIETKNTACVDACPVDCIHPRKNEDDFATETQLYIDPVECIDCGACVPVCPVSAIFALDDLPEKMETVHRNQREALQPLTRSPATRREYSNDEQKANRGTGTRTPHHSTGRWRDGSAHRETGIGQRDRPSGADSLSEFLQTFGDTCHHGKEVVPVQAS